MCGMPIILTGLLGVLYLIGVLAAVLVALVSSDRERRTDARKVLHLLLSALPGCRCQRRQDNRLPRRQEAKETASPPRRSLPAAADSSDSPD
jgi:hypothetical protein